MKRKWLKVLMLLMMAGASFGSPMNPKEIEELMHIMNQTRIEFTLPDEDDKGDGGKSLGTAERTELNSFSAVEVKP
jgi:hypothetical protein